MDSQDLQLSNNHLRYQNYEYRFKTQRKLAASFVCSATGCFSSISLKVSDNHICQPLTITQQNPNHKCLMPGNASYFEVKDFMLDVKVKIASNPCRFTKKLRLHIEQSIVELQVMIDFELAA
jgi:hypothetical protein